MAVLPVDADPSASDLARERDGVYRLLGYLEPGVRSEERLRSLKDLLGRNVCDGNVSHDRNRLH